MNDRADIALLAGAGLHVGQDDLSPCDARRLLGARAFIGLSTTNQAQVAGALSEPVNYVAIGPVFATLSKENPGAAVGLEGVRAAAEIATLPLVAIGGITRETARATLAAGARSLAVIRDLLPDEPSPAGRASTDGGMADTSAELKSAGLLKSLGLIDATALVVGSMIGSGIFIVAADISRQVSSPGLMIMTWVVTAVLTIIAALSYGELAAAMPQAGGQYVYLREAFGPLSGFLYGWTLFLVIQTGTLAAVAVAFAKFAGVFVPWISAHNVLLSVGRSGFSTQQLVAIAVLVLLTWVNTRGVRTGAAVQNTFTTAKVGALLGSGGAGPGVRAQPGRRWPATSVRTSGRMRDGLLATIRLVGVAMVGALFSSDAWNNVTFTAGEIRNPRRNVPLALALGVAVVSAIYLACNLVYLSVLPLEAIQHAAEDRVATAAAAGILGPIAVQVMAAAIMISTFGCLNGMILAGRARLLRHGARRSVLPPGGAPGPEYGTRRWSRSECNASGPAC